MLRVVLPLLVHTFTLSTDLFNIFKVGSGLIPATGYGRVAKRNVIVDLQKFPASDSVHQMSDDLFECFSKEYTSIVRGNTVETSFRLESWIAHTDGPLLGWLISLVTESGDAVHVTTCVTCDASQDREDVLRHVPGGLELCGFCVKVEDATSIAVVQTAYNGIPTRVKNSISAEGWFVLALGSSNPEDIHLYIRHKEGLAKVDYTVFEEDTLRSWIKCRLQASVPMSFEYSSSQEELHDNISSEMRRVESVINQSTTAFHIQHSSSILDNDEFACSSVSQQADCSQLFTIIDDDRADATKKQRKAGDFSNDVVHVTLLNETTGPAAAEYSISCAPVIHHEHREYRHVSVTLPVDVLVYMHAADPLRGLPARLLASIQRQLGALCRCLKEYSQDGEVRTPEVFHFKPFHYDHVVTAVYPRGLSDDQLEKERRTLHSRLLLPLDRPCVRRLNAYQWPDESPGGGYLLNVHHGLQPSKVRGGRASVVSGRYAYHHYLQDRFHDDGWGCAYRSLQTLVSWFRLQGYTAKPVPTHQQMQQILVDIGDKPAKIVGSKTWIGSTEVSYILDSYIDVTSKILFVNSGADLASKGRELATHFDTQGTPVMIGGGVLAHTILGVDFNDVTGDLQFLILDPHYTGGEDLKTIQDKGWCGWKGTDFWDKNAHYNLCMPLRPDVI